MPGDVEQLRAYVEYFRDLGVYDFYRWGEPVELGRTVAAVPAQAAGAPDQAAANPVPVPANAAAEGPTSAVAAMLRSEGGDSTEMGRAGDLVKSGAGRATAPQAETPRADNVLLPSHLKLAPEDRGTALQALRAEIGDCTRCPLAYAGRRTIVFGDGDPAARLMFVGEGPGADEDAQGLPFVGKAGQLLNNMIAAMGLKREQVYIANIVKCRPPANRVPEPVEAGTCLPFLARQIDIVQPQVIVALGTTAATYLLGVRQPLSALRGTWHQARGVKVAVTYHPAFLLRDPRQKGEAWKDLQRVMVELGLKGPAKQ